MNVTFPLSRPAHTKKCKRGGCTSQRDARDFPSQNDRLSIFLMLTRFYFFFFKKKIRFFLENVAALLWEGGKMGRGHQQCSRFKNTSAPPVLLIRGTHRNACGRGASFWHVDSLRFDFADLTFRVCLWVCNGQKFRPDWPVSSGG